ncbi:TRAP transporter small permease [Albimonas pacifica]|uniref:TRAP transporter small permease protein n=1 Tax=Albimonas pacifica TaxID=1114924 RepID=A0A1I3FT55_9RHOB|nr:TRAP transporter small permease [Albimonas pacifica]SFI14410.1 TRAP-type C4-dicarboxylate transport system, small permease component [Albimonas pacifica]
MAPGSSDRNVARSNWFDRATLGLAWVGVGCMLFLAAVIFVSVVMRYLLDAPMLGANEIIQLTAVALVMAGLPWCTAQGAHVGVDVFDRALGRAGRMFGDLLCAALAIVVLGMLARRAVWKALDALEFEDATNMLGLPIWPFYAVLAAGAALSALAFAMRAWALISGKVEP